MEWRLKHTLIGAIWASVCVTLLSFIRVSYSGELLTHLLVTPLTPSPLHFPQPTSDFPVMLRQTGGKVNIKTFLGSILWWFFFKFYGKKTFLSQFNLIISLDIFFIPRNTVVGPSFFSFLQYIFCSRIHLNSITSWVRYVYKDMQNICGNPNNISVMKNK